jgi:TrmH family RNA methyltransferase
VRVIRSADNPLYKQLARWVASSGARRRSGLALLDGIHLVEGALAAGKSPRLLLRESDADEPVLAALSGRSALPAVRLADGLFDRLAATRTPQGVLALIDTPQGSFPTQRDALVVVLDALQDPGNAGAIVRAAAAAGASHVLFGKGSVFAWSPRVVRAGQGAHFHVQVVEEVDITAWLDEVCDHRRVLALSARASEDLFDIALPSPLAFVVGNEGAGVSDAVLARCHGQIAVPMPGRIESLNAAQAATVALFEVVRRSRQAPTG